MIETIKVVKIVRRQDSDGSWRLVATMSSGKTQRFGSEMSERGSRQWLTRRAKQFGLTVHENIAE